MHPLPPGRRVGRWEVTGPIAAGGWASVYAGRSAESGDGDGAEDGDGGGTGGGTGGGVEVALKILPTAGLTPRQAAKVAETARREVEFARRTRHPRLVRLLDTVQLGAEGDAFLDGAIVLVMERAERSLRDLLDSAEVSEAEGGALIAGICEGLAHLHAAGWVHGDLKPDNVLLAADGSVLLADFGLATELTGTGGTHGHAPPMGTFDYLPPERWRAPLGEQGVTVRPSGDIWALGIVVHEVFARGASPFPGATPAARAAAAQEYAERRAPLRMADGVPPFWRALAADCLAPTHAERAAHSAESLLARIRAHRGGGRHGRRRHGPAALAAAAVLASGAAVAGTVAAGWTDAGGGAPAAGHVRVYNADPGCQSRPGRDPQCSLGLAIDPREPYLAGNVVATRVWHGDVLDAECEEAHGVPIVDEMGTQSPRWFRVRLPGGPSEPAVWLPAVRTLDRPELPACPAPSSTG